MPLVVPLAQRQEAHSHRWALERVGRSTLHTLEVIEKLDALGIHFRSYTQGAIDTTSPTGKLVLTILAGVAEMERGMIRERVRSGLAAAKKRRQVGAEASR